MIRINLLPVGSERKRQSGQQQLLLGLILVIIEVVALFFVYSNHDEQYQEVFSEAEALQAEVDRLNQQSAEIDSLNAQKEQLENLGSVLETLEANRAGPVQVLDELKIMLNRPQNDLQRISLDQLGWDTSWDPSNLWLRSFTEQSGSVEIDGTARALDDVSQFNVRLASSPYFSQVRLNDARDRDDANLGPVVDFDLTAQVNYALVGDDG
jgi:Tfp pilus assembly protein PilN